MASRRPNSTDQSGEPPSFPSFRPLTPRDRRTVREYLEAYRPTTSELAVEGLLMRSVHYGTRWSVAGDHLLLLQHPERPDGFALPPVGPPGRVEMIRELFDWMQEEGGFPRPRIERADGRLIEEIVSTSAVGSTGALDATDALGSADPPCAAGLTFRPTPDTFDYLYRRTDLAELRGRRYHGKRNHLRRAERELDPVYETLEPDHVEGCLRLLEAWCAARRCEDDLSLRGDREAIEGVLRSWEDRALIGGVILVEGRVGAFSIAERLNDSTAVVHAEKADPDLAPLYTVVNQRLAAHGLGEYEFVNREQDMGDPGLRRAKRSYHPCGMEEKFVVERV